LRRLVKKAMFWEVFAFVTAYVSSL
jgi:hypothetical protein